MNKYIKWTFIIIIIGTILRFALASIYHISGDACWHLSVARFIATNLKIPLFESLGRSIFWAPPLFHLISAFFYKIFSIFGENVADFSMKMVSPLFGSLTLVFTFLITKTLYNRKIAFYATLFLTFLPIHMYYSSISFIGATLTFFCVAAVYFMLKNKVMVSGLFAGLAISTKYNGVFILPILIFIAINRNKKIKIALKKIFLLLISTILVGLPWLVRNFIYLGNPVWPFLNSLFLGLPSTSAPSTFNIINIFSINHIPLFYLALFGVPHGDYNILFFFNIPFLKLFLLIWFLGTLLYFFPLIRGLDVLKKKVLLIWILSFIFLLVLYLANIGSMFTRLLLPAIPVFAIAWGVGINKVLKKAKFKKIFVIILIVCIVGFVFVEFVKTSMAANAWSFYQDDFNWIKENTPKKSLFYYNGQCLAININKYAMPLTDKLKKGSYIWVNQDFNLDEHSILGEIILKDIETNQKLIYINNKTGTRIYEVIK